MPAMRALHASPYSKGRIRRDWVKAAAMGTPKTTVLSVQPFMPGALSRAKATGASEYIREKRIRKASVLSR